MASKRRKAKKERERHDRNSGRQQEYLHLKQEKTNSIKQSFETKMVIALAYWLRYGVIALILLLNAFITCKNRCFILIADIVIVFLYAMHWIIGYILKWRHIYCAYQNAERKKMTPNHVDWDEVKISYICLILILCSIGEGIFIYFLCVIKAATSS